MTARGPKDDEERFKALMAVLVDFAAVVQSLSDLASRWA